MENRHLETAAEEKRLAKTISIADRQLTQAREAAAGTRADIEAAQKEIRENTEHRITNLYNSDDFEALVELSQSLNPVTDALATYEEEKRRIARLEKVIRCPYFARIDFRFDGDPEAEQIYIGRTSLTEKSSREIYIYDWRSPIASVFYRYMTGRASYEAPCGEITGEVTLKRQYGIEDGHLDYFFDTDRNIQDEFLKQLLYQNTSPQMKAIVETIQEEQDTVIRDMENELLMVQGVAGSGKTSIALHRAAYLMYQGLQNKLAANNILILSPNATFEQYISNVLPELGEENAATAVFEDILDAVLPDRRIQTKNEYLEQAVSHSRYSRTARESMAFKTSEEFRQILERFLNDLPLLWIEFQDIRHDGRCILSREAMREWTARRPEVPLGIRLNQLEEHVLELIFGTGKSRDHAEERNEIRQEMQRFTRFDLCAMYRHIFEGERYLGRDEHLHGIRRYTLENMDSERLFYDDAIAIAYLSLRIYSCSEYGNIRQVVIDEAQDYYPLQYRIFGLIFPAAKFTVLGDINQTLAKPETVTLYDQIQQILHKKNSALITLDKSFRCTSQILQFGLQFISSRPQIQSFNRDGDTPVFQCFAQHDTLLDAIAQEARRCLDAGLRTVCLLCKTEKNAAALYDGLKSRLDLQFVQNRRLDCIEGVLLMPVYLSKGLEFDAVLICDADAAHYYDEDDRKLLYVECTRALHRLSLFCEGERSPLIACGAAER